MKNIINFLIKDIKRKAKSPAGTIIMLIIPIIMTAIFGAVFSPGKQQGFKVKMLVCDKDKSFASNFISRAFQNEELSKTFTFRLTDEEQGKKEIMDNKASSLLIIPKGFQKNILDNKKTEFILWKNPAQQFLPQISEEMVSTLSVAVSGFTNVFEDELKLVKSLSDLSLENIDFNAQALNLNPLRDKFLKLRKFLSPLLIKLEEQTEKKQTGSSGSANVFARILPGISILFILFFIEIFLRDILIEKEMKTLSRIMLTPAKPSEFVLSKIIAGTLMGSSAFLIVILCGQIIFSIKWGNILYLMLLALITSFLVSSVFALVNALCRNKNQASSVSSPLILVMAALGGSMLPYDALPGFIKSLSPFTVNYWFIQGCEEILRGMFPLKIYIILSIASLIIFIPAFILIRKRILK